jgi:hypothetical protein
MPDLDFGVEARGDPVVPGKSPHGGNFGCPTVEGLAELHQLRRDGLTQLVDRFEKTRGQRTALFTGAMLFQEQITEPLFETVDLAHGREAVEVGLQLFGLARLEVVAVPPTGQEVQVDEPDDMKPVRRQSALWENASAPRLGKRWRDPCRSPAPALCPASCSDSCAKRLRSAPKPPKTVCLLRLHSVVIQLSHRLKKCSSMPSTRGQTAPFHSACPRTRNR